jgi:long-chain fatty acid transport protein
MFRDTAIKKLAATRFKEGHMKIVVSVLLVTLCFGITYAGNIDYLTNRSVNYFRNFARNSATDGADLVSYNPAGLVFLDEGFHISFGNEFFLKDYTIDAVPFWDTTSVIAYESDEPTLFYPDLHVVYRTGDWAIFGAFTVLAGGGALDYKDGIYAMSLLETGYQQVIRGSQAYFAVMSEGSIKASSRYIAGTAGASYAINDMFSFFLPAVTLQPRKPTMARLVSWSSRRECHHPLIQPIGIWTLRRLREVSTG